jgi:HlyD family secretion protein
MDTKIVKKKSKLKFVLGGLIILTMVILSSWYFMNQKKTYNVSAENIQTDQVTEGNLKIC